MPDNNIDDLMEEVGIPIYEFFRDVLGYDENADPENVRLAYEKLTKSVCKPCWELKYCPYGPLVEDFPLPRIKRESAIAHNEYLKECLSTGLLSSGKSLDDKRRKHFENEVKSFKADEYPEELIQFEVDASCSMFGHLCPVFFVNEPFTETKEMRRIGRYIPFKTKIRVVRRDNSTCQICGAHLREEDIEFDHIIPISKGGSSEEHNLRVACFECNRSKSNKVEL
ncbi:MAG: HNH endonuclease [Methanobacterium formicicum]